MIWWILLVLYCVFTYGFGFCSLVFVYTFLPHKIHRYEPYIINNTCVKCEYVASIFHYNDHIFIVFAPLFFPVLCIVRTLIFCGKIITGKIDKLLPYISPKNIAKHIRQHIRQNHLNIKE